MNKNEKTVVVKALQARGVHPPDDMVDEAFSKCPTYETPLKRMNWVTAYLQGRLNETANSSFLNFPHPIESVNGFFSGDAERLEE